MRAPLGSDLLSIFTGAHEACLVGGDHRLYAVARAELHQNPGDVRLDRLVADDQFVGDLGVRAPAGQQPQDFLFAGGELLQRRRPALGRLWPTMTS